MTVDPSPSAGTKAGRIERLCQALAVVAVLWTVVSVVVWCRRPAPAEIAEAALAEGRLPLAVECYLAHLVRHPRDWRARLELAAVLDGIDPLQSLVELRKIPPGAEQYEEALRSYRRALDDYQSLRQASTSEPALLDTLINVWKRVSKAYRGLGQHDRAYEALTRAIELMDGP